MVASGSGWISAEASIAGRPPVSTAGPWLVKQLGSTRRYQRAIMVSRFICARSLGWSGCASQKAYGVSCRVRIGSVEILRASEARFTPGQDLDEHVGMTC